MKTYDLPDESDGVPAGKRVVFFATACWDRENTTVPQAVASPSFSTEAALREWCKDTRAKYADRPGFELQPVARTQTVDSRNRPLPGNHVDRSLTTREDPAKRDFVAVQRAITNELFGRATTHVDTLEEKPRAPMPEEPAPPAERENPHIKTYEEVYAEPVEAT